MEKKIFRVLGKKGNTTIPYALRKAMEIKSNELISYEQIDENSILVTREKVCKNDVHKCLAEHGNKEVEKFLDNLTPEQQRKACMYLGVIVGRRDGKLRGR